MAIQTNVLLSEHHKVKHSIEENVKAIKDLIQEASDIKGIIEELAEAGTRKHIVDELKKSLNHINASIEKLLEHTNMLFDAYKTMVTTAFSNK